MKRRWAVLCSAALLAASSVYGLPVQAQQGRVRKAVLQEANLKEDEGLVYSTLAPATETKICKEGRGVCPYL